MATRAGSNTTTDHDEIQRWAEERGAQPACVRGTGDTGDIGILRLDFPGYTGADSLEHISWDDWFQKFEERGLALLHQDTTARGQKSNFNKLVSRETAEAAESGRRSRSASAKRNSGSRSAQRKSTGTRSRSTAAKSRTASSRSSSGSASSRRSGSRSATSRTRSSSTARKSASTRSQANRSRTKTTSRGPSAKASRRSSSTRNARSQSRGSRSSAQSRILTDHDQIRRWAEERDAKPSCVIGTGKRGDTGMIRLDFPGYSGAGSLQPIKWNQWFKSFDDNNLALVVQEKTARGQQSNFNKLIGRETAASRARASHASRRHPERGRRSEGGKVRSISSGRADRDQRGSSRGSNRGARTASARGQNGSTRRRAA